MPFESQFICSLFVTHRNDLKSDEVPKKDMERSHVTIKVSSNFFKEATVEVHNLCLCTTAKSPNLELAVLSCLTYCILFSLHSNLGHYWCATHK